MSDHASPDAHYSAGRSTPQDANGTVAARRRATPIFSAELTDVVFGAPRVDTRRNDAAAVVCVLIAFGAALALVLGGLVHKLHAIGAR